MENKVQLCGKSSTVMQIAVVVVIGVKFLSLTAVTTKSITYSVKISCFDTLCGALPWPVMLVRQKPAATVDFSYKRPPFDTPVDPTIRNQCS